MSFGPVSVTARMEPVPVLARGGLNLDALLYWCAGTGFPADGSDPPPVDIPVERREFAGRAVYLCTDAEYRSLARPAVTWTKRTDGVDAEYLAKKINTSLGPRKNTMKTAPGFITEEIRWSAWGDAAEIERLLRARISGLGAKRDHGYGRVREWSAVEGGREDPMTTLRHPGTGKLRRPLPAEWVSFSAAATSPQPYKPPYWDAGSVCDCYSAGAEASLRCR